MADFKIDGLSTIERRLKGLGRAASRRVIRNVTGGAGRLVTKEVKKTMPRRGQGKGYATGALRKATSFRAVRPELGVVRVKKPAGAHWHLWEFGTSKQAGTFATTRAVNSNLQDAGKAGAVAGIKALDREYTKLGIR